METDEPTQGVRLWDLRPTSCRWPLGRPWDHAEFFCGEPTIPGCSWCKEHRKRALVPTWKRARVGMKAPMVLKDRRR